MEVFGILSLLLSGVLVANMINAFLQQQIRQIGIMKALGASTFQIASLYQGMIFIFSITALLIGIPAGIYVGRGYAQMAAELLNFDIFSNEIPHYIFLVEASIGIIVPLITTAFPIFKGSRVTVREAINDYGISQEKSGGKPSETVPFLVNLLPRTFIMSLRNTFRRKGRLIFTILVMAIGGTCFIVAMNIYASMYNTVDEKMNAFSYNIQISLSTPQPVGLINTILNDIPEVAAFELWNGTDAARTYTDGTTGNSFSIIAPPSDTKLLSTPPLYSGRWLNANDTNALVINQRLLSSEPGIEVGDVITLKINQKDTSWEVIGISKELIGLPAAYTNSNYLSEILRNNDYASNVVITTDPTTSEAEVAKLIEQRMEEEGIPVGSLIKLADYRKSLEDHLLIIATFLIIMSFLVVAVGGLGLATTVSINTLERTREIGILRSIGASSSTITTMIVAEGIFIGILSWVIALVLSWPLSRYVSYQFGMTFFEAPLEFAVSITGFIIWLGILIVFAALSSFYPSRKALRMTLKTTLAYE